MKFAVAASAALSAIVVLTAGCAGTAGQDRFSAPPEALTDCRDVVPPGETEARNICGTPEQWAELDRRVALVDAGVTCREMLTGSTSNVYKTLCYTPEQWVAFEDAQAAESMQQADGARGMAGGY